MKANKKCHVGVGSGAEKGRGGGGRIGLSSLSLSPSLCLSCLLDVSGRLGWKGVLARPFALSLSRSVGDYLLISPELETEPEFAVKRYHPSPPFLPLSFPSYQVKFGVETRMGSC